jgi:peptidoglycan/xylan/chitin deacetylase (PgdA/CDA1 family)
MTLNSLTIVMYHYVRDLKNSEYPEIKGLDTACFKEQLGYIKKYYNVVSGHDLMDAVTNKTPLPPQPLLLTFDDGYIDHFTQVFPVLVKERLPACFFPPAKCILEHDLLDVNKIHFVLAATPDKRKIVDHILKFIDENRLQSGLAPSEVYWKKLAHPNRFDPAEVIFIKRVLQRELPLELRQRMINQLFNRYVTSDTTSFSQTLYMNTDQIRTLQQHGMCVGSHGYDHFWLNTLSASQQAEEIDQSLKFLASVGLDTERWMMCYPYGAYNKSLLSVLKARKCVIGLTTKVGLVALENYDPLTMSRIDTNDLPKDANTNANEWTLRALTT